MAKRDEEITVVALRKMLWEEIYALRKDRDRAAQSRAVSRLAAQILDSVRVEMRLSQMVGVIPNRDFLVAA